MLLDLIKKGELNSSSFLHLIQKPLARTHFKLNLERLQHSIDLALAPEAQHLIAGQLILGYRYYLLDPVLPIGEFEA